MPRTLRITRPYLHSSLLGLAGLAGLLGWNHCLVRSPEIPGARSFDRALASNGRAATRAPPGATSAESDGRREGPGPECFRIFVRGADQGVVPRAEVVVEWKSDGRTCAATARADEQGVARVDEPPAGDVWVRAGARGFTTVRSGPLLAPLDTRAGVNLLLGRAGRIRGRCVHAGEPVERFTLHYWSERAWIVQQIEISTELDGRFELTDVPLGDVLIFGTSREFPQSELHAIHVAPEGVAEIEIELPSPARAIGRIVDARTGAPIREATVQVFTTIGGLPLAPWRDPLPVDGAGALRAVLLSPYENTLEIRAEGYGPVARSGSPDERGILDCGAVALAPAGRLEVRLVGGEASSYPEYRLEVATPFEVGPRMAFDERGVLVVGSLGPGWIHTSIYPPGGRGRIDQLCELRSGQDWTLDFVLATTRLLEIVLVPAEDRPLLDSMFVGVSSLTAGGMRAQHFERVDESVGSLTFAEIQGDLAVVEILDPCFERIATQVVRLEDEPAQHVEIPLERSSRRIRFLDPEGRALEAKNVQLSLDGCEPIWVRRTFTNAEGEIELVGIHAAAVLADVDVASGARVVHLRIPLDGAPQEVVEVRVEAREPMQTGNASGTICQDVDARVRLFGTQLTGSSPIAAVSYAPPHPRPGPPMQTIAKLLSLAAASGLVFQSPGCNAPYSPKTAAAEEATAALAPAELGSTERVHECGGFLLASQPAAADLEVASKRGVRTVIDQRKSTEDRGFNEATLVLRLGMAYVNPSFSKPAELTDVMFDQSREVMRTAQRPVLMHCQSGNRTGTIWLAYRVLDEGIPFDQALAEAKAVGMNSPEFEAKAREYIERERSAK